MQRVVRFALLGLLTASAGLAGCGDKVTVPAQTTTPPDNVVHAVVVSPASVSMAVGAKVTLAASVDAGAGVTNRGVTWSSSNTAVATVGTDGTVTGVTAGTATIIAASAADPNVKGAAAVTVTGGNTQPPTVTISSINQTNAAGQSVPANLTGAFGQLDVILNVDSNGQQLKSVSATMTCPGPTTMTQAQTISAASSDIAAEAAAAPITLSFNTALFNATTGAPTLRNGQCSLAATATTSATTPQTATTNTGLVLANVDGVVLSETFAAYTNVEGVTTKTTANDGSGLPWKGGAVTITALPVLYSGRTITGGGSVSITLPGSTGATQTISPTAAGAVTATWSATAGSGSRVTGMTLYCGATGVAAGLTNCGPLPPQAAYPNEANGSTPLGVLPNVIALDASGNDLGLAVLNFTQPALNLPNPVFRLDNGAVEPPSWLSTPGRQGGWVNGSYVFTGTGGANFLASNGTTKYQSCGDGPNAPAPAGAYACSATAAQFGVSAGSTTGNSGTNGLTTFTYYYMPAASYSAAQIGANGTAAPAAGSLNGGNNLSYANAQAACSTTGWTKFSTGADIAESAGNTQYVTRVFETDALGNARCTDLAVNPNTIAGAAPNINTGAFAFATFGVDKTAPTAGYVDYSAANSPTAASNNDALCLNAAPNLGLPCTRGIANFNITIGLSDNASGFGNLPVTTMVTRLAVDPATGLASNTGGTFNNGFACPSGLSQGACSTTATSQTIRGDANGIGSGPYAATGDFLPGSTPGTPGATNAGCVGCGYFTYSQTPLDLARNAAATVTGTAAPTISGASSTGAPGYRQVVIDTWAPTVGGIAVPASIIGGASASFATSAIDNLDLVSTDYTLTYAAAPSGDPIANLPIRANGPNVGVAFDNVLTTSSSFNLAIPFFIRNVATTTAGGAPQLNGVAPSQIDVRVYDGAGNASAPGTSLINIANVPQNNLTDFTIAPPGANVNAKMTSFSVTNAVANISNCAGGGCPGGVAPANPITVTLTAAAAGVEGANFQFLNPFTQIQFYYFDTVSGQWKLIGTAVAPVVTDNNPPTVRTFTWTLATPFDPPATLGGGPLNILALGVNAVGDGLASAVNTNITLTIP